MPGYQRLIRLIPTPSKKVLRSVKRHLFLPALEELADSPDLFRTYRSLLQDPRLTRKPGGWIYQEKFYPDYLTVGGASQAILQKAFAFCQGRGIDVGAGFWPLIGAIAVDIGRGPGLARHISDFPIGSLDYVCSSHCLEHIETWREALGEWIAKLKPDGRIFLYLPHPECAIWNPGSPFVGDGHKWIPRPDLIRETLRSFLCEILDGDDGPDVMQSFFVSARKRDRNGQAG